MSSYETGTTAPGSITQPNSGRQGGTKAGASTGRKIEGIISGIHDAGEQIRGQFNMAAARALHDHEGQARNQAIFDRGREEYNTGRIIDNPDKRRYSREIHPSSGGNTMVGVGATTGTGAAMERGMPIETGRGTTTGTETAMGTGMPADTRRSTTTGTGATMTGAMSQSTSLTEGSYGERGPANATADSGSSYAAGGPAVGGGHYVDEPRERI